MGGFDAQDLSCVAGLWQPMASSPGWPLVSKKLMVLVKSLLKARHFERKADGELALASVPLLPFQQSHRNI